MKKKYGPKKSKRVFYASRNKKTITGVEESVFNTYRTLAYLLEAVIKHKATGLPYGYGRHIQVKPGMWHGGHTKPPEDPNVPETKREYRFRVPGDTKRRAVASVAAHSGSKKAKKDVETLKQGSGVLRVHGPAGKRGFTSHPVRKTTVTKPAPEELGVEPGGTVTHELTSQPGSKSLAPIARVTKPGKEKRVSTVRGTLRGSTTGVNVKNFPTRWSGKGRPGADDT